MVQEFRWNSNTLKFDRNQKIEFYQIYSLETRFSSQRVIILFLVYEVEPLYHES